MGLDPHVRSQLAHCRAFEIATWTLHLFLAIASFSIHNRLVRGFLNRFLVIDTVPMERELFLAAKRLVTDFALKGQVRVRFCMLDKVVQLLETALARGAAKAAFVAMLADHVRLELARRHHRLAGDTQRALVTARFCRFGLVAILGKLLAPGLELVALV